MARSWQRRVVRMKVVCAWCEREGKPSYLGEWEPYDNPAATHGICSRHKEQALEALPSQSFPDAEMLIIVRPNDTDLYEYLLRRFVGVQGVRVILERRGRTSGGDDDGEGVGCATLCAHARLPGGRACDVPESPSHPAHRRTSARGTRRDRCRSGAPR